MDYDVNNQNLMNSNQEIFYENDQRSKFNEDEKNDPDKLEKFTNILLQNTPKHVLTMPGNYRMKKS